MARPSTNKVDFFMMKTHPSRTELMLKAKFGLLGQVFFLELFRVLADDEDHCFDARNTEDLEFLAQKCESDWVSVAEILDYLAFLRKIDAEMWAHRIIFYPGFVSSLKEVYRKRKRPEPTIQDIRDRFGINQRVSVAETTHIDIFPSQKHGFSSQSVAESTHSKVKESKEKSSKLLKKNKTSNDDIDTSSESPPAALLETKNQEPDIGALIERIFILRKKDSKKPIGDERVYKNGLWKAYKDNPDLEVTRWKQEIQEAVEIEQKRREAEMAQQGEAMEKQSEEKRVSDEMKERRTQAEVKYKFLSPDELKKYEKRIIESAAGNTPRPEILKASVISLLVDELEVVG